MSTVAGEESDGNRYAQPSGCATGRYYLYSLPLAVPKICLGLERPQILTAAPNPASLHPPPAALAGFAQRATLAGLNRARRLNFPFQCKKQTHQKMSLFFKLRGKDLNQRPPGYEPDELPTALPRDI